MITVLVMALGSVAFAADSDGDTIDDTVDNCPTIRNTDQANRDGDAEGDACEQTTVGPDVTQPIAETVIIGGGASITGFTTLGTNLVIAPKAVITGGPDAANTVTIGSGSLIGRRTTVGGGTSVGASTELGRAVSLGAGGSLGGTNTFGYAVQVGDGAVTSTGVVLANLVSIGDRLNGGATARVGRGAQLGNDVKLGVGCIVGPGVTGIGTGEVPDDLDCGDNVKIRRDARIGDNVTIGIGALIGRGVQVGDGAQIAAGSIVRAGATVAAASCVDGVVGRGETSSEPCNTGETLCNDGSDNDGDSLLDCEDSDCFSDPACVFLVAELSNPSDINNWEPEFEIVRGNATRSIHGGYGGVDNDACRQVLQQAPYSLLHQPSASVYARWGRFKDGALSGEIQDPNGGICDWGFSGSWRGYDVASTGPIPLRRAGDVGPMRQGYSYGFNNFASCDSQFAMSGGGAHSASAETGWIPAVVDMDITESAVQSPNLDVLIQANNGLLGHFRHQVTPATRGAGAMTKTLAYQVAHPSQAGNIECVFELTFPSPDALTGQADYEIAVGASPMRYYRP